MTIRSAAPRRVLALLGVLSLILTISNLPSPSVLAQQATSAQQAATTQQAADAQMAPLPLSPVEKAQKDGTALPLSLKDITKLALQNNLNIAIQDTNEQLYQQRIIQAYGPYDPTLTVGLGVRSTKSPNTRQDTKSTAGNFNKTDFANWNSSITQNFKTGGGISASYNSSRNDNNQLFSLFTPQYNSSLSLNFTQPLRRDFRIDQYRGTIKLANLDIKVNDSKFKQSVAQTISTIQGQYWDLVGAIRNYEIKRKAVELAQITLRDNKKKVEIGTAAPITVTEALATMAQRQVDLISAEEIIYNSENALRALISNDRNAEIWHKVIVPTETPDFKEYKVDLDVAIDTALKNRPELEQVDLSLQGYDISQRMSENMQKWRFDLAGSFGTTGVAGPQSYTTDPLTGQQKILIDPNLVGGIGNANKLLFSGGYINWAVGFNIQIPLRNRTVDAQLAQIKIQKRQQLMTRKNTEQQIQVDIRNAVQRIETNRQQVETARLSRQLTQEQLDGEEKRFQAGLSQNFLVLSRQNDLTAAQGVELQALIAYKKSIITLQQAMYTLLEANDFEIAKTSSDNVPNLK